MLVIRKAQWRALGMPGREAFEAELCDLFVGAYPRETRQAGGPGAMLAWVRAGLDAAAAAGYATQHQGGRWLLMMLILGVDFAHDPQLPWVQAALDPALEPDASERVDAAFAATLDYLGLVAGEDAERVVKAMLRMRAVDFSTLPDLDADAAVADTCDRLARLYPEKAAFRGPGPMARHVALLQRRAATFGLHEPPGRFLYVLLAFMLGSGFDHDPLHPWAGALLRGAAREDGPALAARLEQAAREHLALSLTRGTP